MFDDRTQAGYLLAQKLKNYNGRIDFLVLGIPRGGVVTAKAISDELQLPLDVIVARKIGAPNQEELAIGAVSEGGSYVLDQKLVDNLEVGDSYIKKAIREKKKEVRERARKFRVGRSLKLEGETVILVDDGVATGSTVEAATSFLRKSGVKKIILAVPVISPDALESLKPKVDEAFVLETPQNFHAVGQFYRFFPQVTDEEVIQLLQ